MTMTPDDLRALADALEPMARAPRFEDFDVPAFCAWVRACADAEPVARIYTDGWQLVPVKPTREMLESTSWPGCAATDYEHMLAAAPQAEPIDPHMIAAEGRFPDAPQAEPMTWLSTDDAETQLALAIQDAAKRAPTSDDKALLAALNGRGIWLAWIGDAEGAQAEPCVGNDPTCPCQDGDTCHYRDTDRTKAWPIPDAEPSNNCRGVPRRGCNYLSQCGSVCNKCGHIHNPVADAVTAQVEPIDPHMIAAEDRFPDDDGPVILGEPDTLTPDDVRRVTRRAEPKRPIIEVNVFPQHEYWRVELAVGTETFVFDEVRVSQTNAEAYANRLRVALGITGDSDAD